MKIGENLKKLRKRANLTQQDVSQMLGFKNHTGYAHGIIIIFPSFFSEYFLFSYFYA